MNRKIEIDYGNFISINIDKFVELIPSLLPEQFRVKRLRYILVSDNELLEINLKYLQHDFYTDIITFDYSKGNVLRGEIYISMDRVVDNSEGDVLNELLRVVSHGVLHLMGYKDKTNEEKITMRRMENMWIEKMLVSRET